MVEQERRSGLWNRSRNNYDDYEEGLIDNGRDRIPSDETVETDNYNEADSSIEPIKHTSQLSALFIIINVTIGVGLLAMPAAMQTAGLIPSMIIQLIFLVLIMTTCIIITELTFQTKVDSFHRVVKAHCHPYIYQFAQACILLLVFGTTVAYIVTIGDQSDRILRTLYGATFCHTWYMNRRFIMIMSTILVIQPLCVAKTIDFLKYASSLGLASVCFIIYVVITEFSKIKEIPSSVNYLPSNFIEAASILPVFCLAYQCHLSWVPIAASMRREEKRSSYITISIAMIVAFIIYSGVSVLAVLTFGSNIQNDLTESYPGKGWSILTTIGIVALKCIVTLPPAFLPARLSLIDIFDNLSEKFSNWSERTKRFVITFSVLKIALLLALFVPDILMAVNILGCLSVMFLFTLPALSYLNHIKENRVQKQLAENLGDVPIYSTKDKFKRWLSFFVSALGLILMLGVLYKSVSNIMNSRPSPPLCIE